MYIILLKHICVNRKGLGSPDATRKRGQYVYVRVLCFEKPFQVADARRHRRESLQYHSGWQIMALPHVFSSRAVEICFGSSAWSTLHVSR